jgi:hypothetical protein
MGDNMEIESASKNELDLNWRWKDRSNNFYYPKDMETKHLFFTLRMIWNHTMPVKTGKYTLYRFGDFYTKKYMLEAVKHLAIELSKRKDLEPSWQMQLRFMVNWLSTNQVGFDGFKFLLPKN